MNKPRNDKLPYDWRELTPEQFDSEVKQYQAAQSALPYVWETELCTICKCDPCDCPTDFWRDADGNL
jgi:hypothetical protein